MRPGIWVFALLLLGLTLVASEVGYRLGRRRCATLSPDLKAHTTAIQAALLGILGLLLGFTFSMAASRYDMRKNVIVREANAISTAYLRTEWLPEPARASLRADLVRYVDARIDFYRAGPDVAQIREEEIRARELQSVIWSKAIAAVEGDPRQGLAAVLVLSLNEMIDLGAERLAALENHVPDSIIGVLMFAAVVAMGAIGHGAGVGERRSGLSMIVLPIIVTVVIGLIVDLDRPTQGLIQLGQKSMLRLQQSLVTPQP